MPDLLDRLVAEHQLIRSGLRMLMGVAERVHGTGDVPVDTFGTLLDFFVEFAARDHHEAEARLLYPVVAAADDDAAGLAGELLHDHAETSQALHALALYRRCRRLPDADERAAFVLACRSYATRLEQHMAEEESGVFVTARQLPWTASANELAPASSATRWSRSLQELAASLDMG